jgi:flagellin
MRINHNIAALNTYRQLAFNNTQAAKNIEKLSSGLRINRAGDDAAGLAISEKMRGQIRGLEMAAKNSQDAISLIQTAEGALNETHAILQRMRELAVQASNGTNTDEDRQALNEEVQQLKTEITRIGTQTEFNTQKLLDGTFGSTVDQDANNTTALTVTGVATVTTSGGLKAGTYTISWNATDNVYELQDSGTVIGKAKDLAADGAGSITFMGWDATNSKDTGVSLITVTTNGAYMRQSLDSHDIVIKGSANNFQIGSNQGQVMGLSINDMTASGLAVDTVAVDTYDNAQSAIASIDNAIKLVSQERSKLGAYQNRLEHTINNLGTAAENLTAAESRIRDVDYALAA